MKKLLLNSMLIFAIALFFTPNSSADIIPPNSHKLEQCARVMNLEEFPNIVLIAQDNGPMSDEPATYQIENNQCLTKVYKYNSLSIYWANKEEATSINPDNLLLENAPTYGGYVDESNPLIKKEIEYSIVKFEGDELGLYISKTIAVYIGAAEKIETFEKPISPQNILSNNQQALEATPDKVGQGNTITATDAATSTTAKKGFWKKMGCFFKKLFGGSCS